MNIRSLFGYLKQESAEKNSSVAEVTPANVRAIETLKESDKDQELFHHAFDNATAASALIDSSGRFLKVNRALCNVFGYTKNEFSKMSLQSITHEEDVNSFSNQLTSFFDGTLENGQTEQRVKHKQGHFLWATWTVSQAPLGSEIAPHLVFQLQKVLHRKRSMEKRSVLNSLRDSLTELPNRVLLMERLQTAFDAATSDPDKLFAVFFIDFDRFGLVSEDLNDIADEQLHGEIGKRLKSLLKKNDIVAKLSGNEFTVLLEEVKTTEDIIKTAERVIKDFAKPLTINNHEIAVSPCIGIAVWSPQQYERPDFMLRDANSAFYQAKRLGGARYELYNSEVYQRARHHIQLENDLRLALENNEFCLHYQPVIELKTCRLVGFEALIRWQHPTRGLVSPIDFISVAEENGLISPIGLWVLQEACRQLSDWQKRYPSSEDLWMSVNVSGKQIIEPNFVNQVVEILHSTGLPPRVLKLEVTESAMIDNMDQAVSALGELKQHGVKLSVDDFGTGYSNLSNLHRLPIDSLKIDRSFITNMQGSDENWEIIESVIKLGQRLNLEIIAEGVETGKQVVDLQNLACTFGQGFYFAQPLEPAAVENLLDELKNIGGQNNDDSPTR